MRKNLFSLLLFLLIGINGKSQTIKILFDATKAETASNADWVIDEDLNNMTWNPNATTGSGSEGNAQRIPTPAQLNITSATLEGYWKGALSSWGIDCVKRGYVVETLPHNGAITYGNSNNLQDLSNYKVFIIVEPNILFTTSEKTAIINFVKNGGGLFIVSDHAVSDRNNDGKDSPQILNDLIKNNSVQNYPFGFVFDSLNISPNTTNIPYLPNDSILNGPMGAVTQATWFNGTSMTLNPSANSSVKGVIYTPSSSFGNTGVMVAYARYGKGKVVGFGDSSPCDDGTGDNGDNLYDGWITDANGNHERLIMNATIWLTIKDTIIPTVIPDLTIDSILYPQAITRGNNQVALKIKNIGNTYIDTALVTFQINNNTPVSAQITNLNIAPQNSNYYSFTTPLNITTGGIYKLCVWIKTNGDRGFANDTLCKVYHLPLITDMQIDSISDPVKFVKGLNTISVNIRNNGETMINKYTVSYHLLEQFIAPVTDEVTLINLPAGSYGRKSFSTRLNIEQAGDYNICVWIDSVNGIADNNRNNDTLCYQFTVEKTALNEINLNNEIQLFPNPSNQNLLYITSFHEEINQITICDTKGSIILSETNLKEKQVSNKNISINTAKIEAGIYFIHIETANGIAVKKWIKQ